MPTDLYTLSRELAALDSQIATATPTERGALAAQRAELYAQHEAALAAHLGVSTPEPGPATPGIWRARLDASCRAYEDRPSPATWQARHEVLQEGVESHRRWLSSADGRRLILDGANLVDASLVGASLDGASLVRASLVGARLDGASLVGASLDAIRDDIYRVLGEAPDEVPYLLLALRTGQIDGSTYEGECACLVGTLQRACGTRRTVTRDGNRPAERWFLAIRPGDTPARSQIARITEGWVVAWLGQRTEVRP